MNTRQGEIYDLGYRNYTGPRLGKSYRVRSLFTLSLRHTFGLGRGVAPKVIAGFLIAFALVPALVQVIFAAVAPTDDDFEFVSHADYYGYVTTIVVLFVAAMATDLVGNDRKNNVLPLYWSRPLLRSDYVFAKVAALTTGLQALTLLPQLFMFAGNWLGAPNAGDYLADNAADVPRIVASALLVSAQLGAVGILIASLASRRAFAIGATAGFLLVSFGIATALAALVPEGLATIIVLISPVHVVRGATMAIFDAWPRFPAWDDGPDRQLAAADLPAWTWVLVSLAHTALAVWITMRRYRSTV